MLVDCGMFQGLKELRERNWQDPPFDPRALDAVLITHAHIDHTGYLPRLVKQGFKGPVYCSRGTADLLKILLPDAGRLQEEDADYRNRHKLTKHKPALPLYTEEDAFASLELIRPLPNTGEAVDVAKGIRAGFAIAGHILGSSMVLVEIDGAGADATGVAFCFLETWVTTTSRSFAILLRLPACDYLLVESTYGDRLHDPEDPKVALTRIITDAAQRNSAVLIPAFAVGRTQELVYLIRELEDEKAIPVLPVYRRFADGRCGDGCLRKSEGRARRSLCECAGEKQHPLRTHSMVTATSRAQSKV